MDREGEMEESEEAIEAMESLSTIISTDDEYNLILQVAQNIRSLVNVCQVQQKEVQTCAQGLREKVKAKEQRILNAQKSNLKDEELEELRNNLAQARIEEEKARATVRSMEEHLDGLEEQLQSVEAQKQTLESLANEEIQLKNELSLFSTISGIIPDLSKTHVFAGSIQSFFKKNCLGCRFVCNSFNQYPSASVLFNTVASSSVFISNTVIHLNQETALLDKEDVTKFTIDCSDMSAYQQSKTIWDMIR